MTPGFEVDDDAAPFIRSRNGNASKAISPGTIDDDLVSRVLPRVDTTAVEGARAAIGSESENESDEEPVSPQQLRRSLSEPSLVAGSVKGHSDNLRDTATERTHAGEASGPRRDSAEFDHVSRPLSRAEIPLPDYSHTKIDGNKVTVSARRSPRPDRNSIDSIDQIAKLRDYNKPQRPPRAEEIEAARRILAQVAEDGECTSPEDYSPKGRRRTQPPRANARSATPPPISRPRRRVIYDSDDFEDEDEQEAGAHTDPEDHDYHAQLRNGRRSVTTPVTAIHLPEEKPRSPSARPRKSHDSHGRPASLSRTSSRRSPQAAARSRAATALTSHKHELRTPIFEENYFYQDAEPPPISQRREDHTRSRRQHKKYAGMGENGKQEHSMKNGHGSSSMTPEYRPPTADKKTICEDSVSISRQSTSKHSVTSSGSSRTVDFFGPGIFQIVLHNPTTAHQLLKFAEARFCSESVEFLKKVEQYQTVLNDLAGIVTSIHKDFLSEDSPKQINVKGEVRKAVRLEMKSLVAKTLPSMETLFSDLQQSIEQDVFLDIYPRFVRYQMALSATMALANERHTYQGLGDCFCLTNPLQADNPIVYASDGFIKVTGYTRPEIIPRNCRFLQGEHTDRAPVRRLKKGIEERKETVELLLNYKKNGDPFWNLLYVAPLYNEAGKLAFFLGGQINCSTTIHSNADVMRVLSTSNKDDTQNATKQKAPLLNRASSLPSARKAFLKALGMRVEDQHPYVNVVDPGMESKLLPRLEGQDLDAQKKEFYTAYSKVGYYDSFIIKFYSEGVLDMLHPANNTVGLVTGQEVFRFLKQNMVNNQSDYKARVRNAIRSGAPASVEVRLQTRRSAIFRGDERFMTHWTPLKNEKAQVHWVIVTMALTIQ
ncbi:Blue-light-activated histidine kinase 1-like protein 4 [Colletotrichum chlorophyti]|uniref:Blue-light-activated histidine kinase 1-like protein 4 n=1 Tax=Colletotrichum chlorophyti TaxID=708187 RepID=A0A1Q8RPA6_9PEZI|nr:Blue-light-activated histidine kinase 1-like protein 4 [Colletotrichum chlorophyti]